MTHRVLFELFGTNLLLFEHQLFSRQFCGPYGGTKYGSGLRKDVVNQCLEFECMVVWCTRKGSSFTWRELRVCSRERRIALYEKRSITTHTRAVIYGRLLTCI